MTPQTHFKVISSVPKGKRDFIMWQNPHIGKLTHGVRVIMRGWAK